LQSQLNKIFRYLITHTIFLHLYSIILEPKSLFIQSIDIAYHYTFKDITWISHA